MLTKTKVILSALLLLGSTATALAVDPQGKLGDRYPFLEYMDQEPLGMGAYAYVPAQPMFKGYTAGEKALFDRMTGAEAW